MGFRPSCSFALQSCDDAALMQSIGCSFTHAELDASSMKIERNVARPDRAADGRGDHSVRKPEAEDGTTLFRRRGEGPERWPKADTS